MPTYHLAVVVDDYLMKITHAFRGEEWLPSAPVHILLWRYFGWQEQMPKWAHLPLILKPDGKGKLSKRDGDRLGFPVFAMDWKDPATGEVTTGFRERGFLPEAFVNLLALLGWNDGTEQEIFTIAELIERFSLERVHKGGAKFNYEKAKWFNHEWIKRTDNSTLAKQLAAQAAKHNLQVSWPNLERICGLVKDRCMLLSDLWDNSYFFFEAPGSIEMDAIAPKWNGQKREFFVEYMRMLENGSITNVVEAESKFKDLATSKNIKPGDVLLPFRIMLVGKKIGPGVFDIADTIGKEETVRRISQVLDLLA
jgi:glutamyl-tRNA synthetase